MISHETSKNKSLVFKKIFIYVYVYNINELELRLTPQLTGPAKGRGSGYSKLNTETTRTVLKE